MGCRFSRIVQLSVAALVCAASTPAAFAQGNSSGPAKPPIMLESTGAYEVGGRMIANPANANETLSCDHGYVEYFIPQKRRQVGLIMWHSNTA